MTIETINARIENLQKKLDKLNKKMARIEKAEKSGWERNNPYSYGEYDKVRTQKDINEAEKSLKMYQDRLEEESNKASSRNIPVLVKFLNNWKEDARSWYNERRTGALREKMKKAYEDASNERKAFRDTMASQINQLRSTAEAKYQDLPITEREDAIYEEIKDRIKALETKNHELYKKADKLYKDYITEFAEIINLEDRAFYEVRLKHVNATEAEYKARGEKFISWKADIPESTEEEKQAAWDALLEKLLSDEWNRKYDKLLEDVIRITGTIKDASYLEINAKGDLDGYIEGEKGTAKINTFGAGGYNIQCFHYRTKVTKIK